MPRRFGEYPSATEGGGRMEDRGRRVTFSASPCTSPEPRLHAEPPHTPELPGGQGVVRRGSGSQEQGPRRHGQSELLLLGTACVAANSIVLARYEVGPVRPHTGGGRRAPLFQPARSGLAYFRDPSRTRAEVWTMRSSLIVEAMLCASPLRARSVAKRVWNIPASTEAAARGSFLHGAAGCGTSSCGLGCRLLHARRGNSGPNGARPSPPRDHRARLP